MIIFLNHVYFLTKSHIGLPIKISHMHMQKSWLKIIDPHKHKTTERKVIGLMLL